MLEIGSQPCVQGDIYAVKVLGILGMIDGGEMDWKLVVIAASDPLANTLDGEDGSVCALSEALVGMCAMACSMPQLVLRGMIDCLLG